jgi:hypothetical protein
MDERRKRTGLSARRVADSGGRRRITKSDGKFADYSKLKSSAGIVIPEVKKVVLDRQRKPHSHRTGIIYPSEMAKSDWCPRATYWRMSGRSEPLSKASFSLENVFAEGNAIHDKWQSWLSDTGLLWGDWKCTRCSEQVKNSLKPDDFYSGECVGTSWIALATDDMRYPHTWKYREVSLTSTSHNISGHSDGALVGHNVLIELKSVGIGTLRFEAPRLLEENTHTVPGKKIVDIEGIWKNIHRPFTSHIKQGNIYLFMAKEMGMPFDRITFVYEFKANQQAKEFTVSMSDDIMEPLLETASVIENGLITGIPPICPYGGCGSCRSYET